MLITVLVFTTMNSMNGAHLLPSAARSSTTQRLVLFNRNEFVGRMHDRVFKKIFKLIFVFFVMFSSI